MDSTFACRLVESGIGKEVLKVLEEQKVLSLRVFRAMKEDHIVQLLQCSGMPIGEHALLWELWEKESATPPRVARGGGGIAPNGSLTPSPLSTSSSSSLVMSSPEDRKELFKRYQLKMRELKGSKMKSSPPPRHVKIQVGGMIFDDKLGKGVKKRYIPSSQTMTFPANASYDLVIEKAREMFFPDEINEECFVLADSGGVPYVVKNKPEWVLSEFVEGLKQPPSKLRIYILYMANDQIERPVDEKPVVVEEKDDKASAREHTNNMVSEKPPINVQPPPLIQAEAEASSSEQRGPVIKHCITCREPFRTYVAGKDTIMPDGTSFFYSVPQEECPACDVSNWGWQWNKDLFPQFA